jgi:phospholipid/cholesterol/gamma-HCH transport system permease protein
MLLLEKIRFLFKKSVSKLIILNYLGEYSLLIWDVCVLTLKKPPSWSLIREQLYHIGVLSLPVVAMTGFSTGLVLAAQSFFQLADKGLASATGVMVAKAMLTELGPVLTAFMVTGRVGAAMCAELGSMQVTEQIDALITMAVTPNRYLIAPRFIAGVVMMPLLTAFSVFMGIFGGYLIAVYYFKMSAFTFFDPIPHYIQNFDFFIGFVKTIVFGIFIVTVSCYKGINTRGGAEGVGRATTNSVVICYTCILFSNFLITLGLNTVKEQIDRLFV